MPRKKKEETPEVKPEVKEIKKESKPNIYGWHYVQNKAKFTPSK